MAKYLARGEGFSIEFEPRPGYLRACVFGGTDSEAVSIGYYRMVGEECARLGVDRLLLVEDLDGQAPTESQQARVHAAIESGFDRLRIAFVDLRGEAEENIEGELVWLMHGITVMLFVSEEQAHHWLLYGGDATA